MGGGPSGFFRGALCAWLVMAMCLAIVGCVPPDPGPDPANDDDMTDELEARGWEGVFTLISFRCGCHDSEERAGDMWDLTDEDSAYAVLVGTPSNDLPSMARVEPGDPDDSYLVAKIEGRGLAVGGLGDRMPPTGFALPDDDIELIREWITDGATQE